jgi:hypothetical protein
MHIVEQPISQRGLERLRTLRVPADVARPITIFVFGGIFVSLIAGAAMRALLLWLNLDQSGATWLWGVFGVVIGLVFLRRGFAVRRRQVQKVKLWRSGVEAAIARRIECRVTAVWRVEDHDLPDAYLLQAAEGEYIYLSAISPCLRSFTPREALLLVVSRPLDIILELRATGNAVDISPAILEPVLWSEHFDRPAEFKQLARSELPHKWVEAIAP